MKILYWEKSISPQENAPSEKFSCDAPGDYKKIHTISLISVSTDPMKKYLSSSHVTVGHPVGHMTIVSRFSSLSEEVL